MFVWILIRFLSSNFYLYNTPHDSKNFYQVNWISKLYIYIYWYKTPSFPQHCWHLWKRPFDLSDLVHCNRPHLTFWLVNSYQSNKRLNRSFDFTSKNYFFLITMKKCESRQSFGVCVTRGCMTVLTCILFKNSENELRVYLPPLWN